MAPTVRASPHADAPMWRVVTHVRQERRAGGPLPEDNATVRELTPTRSATDPDEINEARESSRRLQIGVEDQRHGRRKMALVRAPPFALF